MSNTHKYVWHIRKSWPHRHGNSGVRYFIRECIKDIRHIRSLG